MFNKINCKPAKSVFFAIQQCYNKNILLILQNTIIKNKIFSAVELVAFSLSGMVNEVEEKKVEIETIEIETIELEKIIQTDCRVERLSAYTEMRSAGASHSEASGVSYAIYFNCLNMQTTLVF